MTCLEHDPMAQYVTHRKVFRSRSLLQHLNINYTLYVEIKCQLDATEVLLQILLLAQHVSGNTMPIIRSSRVLYGGCCLWYFVLGFSSCWSGVELSVMCPVCRMLQHPANRTRTWVHWTHVLHQIYTIT